MNVYVNEARDSDSNKDPTYIPQEENSNNTEINEESSNICGKYTALNHLCFKTGYSCQTITNFNVSVTSLLCK
jgi:hypothetical protein